MSSLKDIITPSVEKPKRNVIDFSAYYVTLLMSAIHRQNLRRQTQKNVLRQININGYEIGDVKLGMWHTLCYT